QSDGQPELDGLGPLAPAEVAPAALLLASELCGDRSGEVLAVAGGRVALLRVAESRGAFKEGPEPWSAAELADCWERFAKPK
ncbi:MAG: hypothetical protein JRI23_18450, partial [Deltaproteobacteria bacterium]|nr:hypothetical protein [Deltaproteobacteria bacterium]MBW2533842.1 hypothetical protein [Deltaproteobacteria bacterium]